MKGKRVWKKGETPHCEVECVEFPRGLDDLIIIHHTPRGAREVIRRDRAERRRQAYLRKHPPKNCGCDIGWFLFGPFYTDRSGRRRPVFS